VVDSHRFSDYGEKPWIVGSGRVTRAAGGIGLDNRLRRDDIHLGSAWDVLGVIVGSTRCVWVPVLDSGEECLFGNDRCRNRSGNRQQVSKPVTVS